MPTGFDSRLNPATFNATKTLNAVDKDEEEVLSDVGSYSEYSEYSQYSQYSQHSPSSRTERSDAGSGWTAEHWVRTPRSNPRSSSDSECSAFDGGGSDVSGSSSSPRGGSQGGRGSSESDSDGSNEPFSKIVREAAEQISQKLSLDLPTNGIPPTPPEIFKAAREIFALPEPKDVGRWDELFEDQAKNICSILGIDLSHFDESENESEESYGAVERKYQQEKLVARVESLREEIDAAIGCGDVNFVTGLQTRLESFEPVELLEPHKAAIVQLNKYCKTLPGMEELEEEEDERERIVFEMMDLMRGWQDSERCAPMFKRLAKQFLYVTPTSVHPRMELIGALSSALLNKQFCRIVGATLIGRVDEVRFGYALSIMDQTFLFDFETKAEGIELFNVLFAAHQEEYKERKEEHDIKTVKNNAEQDLDDAKKAVRYRDAMAAVLEIDEWGGQAERLEALLIADKIADFYIMIKGANEEHKLLLNRALESFVKARSRVRAIRHPACKKAIDELGALPFARGFQNVLAAELHYNLINTDMEQLHDLARSSAAEVRGHMETVVKTFEEEVKRLDLIDSNRDVQSRWKSRLFTGVVAEKGWQESEESKERRRMFKARLKGRRKGVSIENAAAAGNVAAAARGRLKFGVSMIMDKNRQKQLAAQKFLDVVKLANAARKAEGMTAEEAFNSCLDEERSGLLALHIRRQMQNRDRKEQGDGKVAKPETHTASSQIRAGNIFVRVNLPRTALPERLRATVQAKSGYDISSVRGGLQTATILDTMREFKKEAAASQLHTTQEKLVVVSEQLVSHKSTINTLQTEIGRLRRPQEKKVANQTKPVSTTNETQKRICLGRCTTTDDQAACQTADATGLRFLSKFRRQCRLQQWPVVLSMLYTCADAATEVAPRMSSLVDKRGASMLHHVAASCPDFAVVQAAIQCCRSMVCQADTQGRLPIHLALASHATPDAVLAFIRADPVALQVEDGHGHTPLAAAIVSHCSLSVLQMLLRHSPEVCTRRDQQSRGLAHLAVGSGCNVEFLKQVVRGFPAGLEAQDADGDTPLHSAFRPGAAPLIAAVTAAVAASAVALDVPNNAGDLPLHLAISSGAPLEVLELLVTHRPSAAADRNWTHNTPLHLAALCRTPAQAIQLMLAGCPSAAHVRAENGSTMLHCALDVEQTVEIAGKRHEEDGGWVVEVVSAVLHAWPAAAAARRASGQSCLSAAVSAGRTAGVLQLLAAASPAAVLEPWHGTLPLQALLSLDEDETQAADLADRVHALLQAAPTAAAADCGGLTPLETALERRSGSTLHEVVGVLLAAAPNAAAVADPATGETALHKVASRPGWQSGALVAQALLRAGPLDCGLQVTTAGGATPLHLSLERGATPTCARMLLTSCPTAATVADRRGCLPLHTALRAKSPDLELVAALLAAHPAAAGEPDGEGHLPLYAGLLSDLGPAVLAAVVPPTMKAVRRAAVAADLVLDSPAGQLTSIYKHGGLLPAGWDSAAGKAPQLELAQWSVAETSQWLTHVALPAEPADLDSPGLLALARGSLPQHTVAGRFACNMVDGLVLAAVLTAQDRNDTLTLVPKSQQPRFLAALARANQQSVPLPPTVLADEGTDEGTTFIGARQMVVVGQAQLRATAARDSLPVGELERGETVEILQRIVPSGGGSGGARVRTVRGWTSEVALDGTLLLAKAPAASEVAVPPRAVGAQAVPVMVDANVEQPATGGASSTASDGWMERGLAAVEVGELDAAIDAFMRARQLEPDQSSMIAYNLACCYCLASETARAMYWTAVAVREDGGQQLRAEDFTEDPNFASVATNLEFISLLEPIRI